jgi:thiamine biosynthesis lipoprotein
MPMHRRDLWQTPHLAHTAGQVVGLVDAVRAELPTRANADARLLWASRLAMATTFAIALPFGTPAALARCEDALAAIDAVEDTLTVYRADSLISRVNAHAHATPVPVPADVFDLLTLCAQLHTQTDGAFDAASGTLTKAWGFFRRQGQMPTAAALRTARAASGWRNVLLNPAERSVRLIVPGLELNFGSIGKGYALDQAGQVLRDWGTTSALLHGGASSVVAVGAAPHDPRGWRVGLLHPGRPDVALGQLWLRDQALGTSAATFQHFTHAGRTFGHVLDPRRGWPAHGIASASVVAPTAALADALSTAFYVAGLPLAERYCAEHPDVGAVILPAESESPVVLNLSPATVDLTTSFVPLSQEWFHE